MNKRKKFISLNLKMTVAVLLGIVLAGGMYLACTAIENYVVDSKYLSVEAVDKNANAAYDSLEKYIEKNKVKAADSKALSKWVKKQEYTYFFVYDNYSNVFEAGWWIDANSAAPDEDQTDEGSTLYENTIVDEDRRIDEDTFTTDAQNRIIEFADGKYYTFIDTYKERRFQDMMELTTVILCFLTLLTVVLVYNKTTLRRIIRLAGEVQHISDGSLDYGIHHVHNDEIGTLAISVDNMRSSIIQKHRNEREAWEANTQLITAMSHDIRTPLTSMIGYLDIIEGKKYETNEDLEKYISSCRDKAFQLKDLSDKLFQYFLVFGNPESEKQMEKYDASILFQQLLAEHSAELVGYGFKSTTQFNVPEVDVRADISGIRRLFDNVFSNIMKYADISHVIKVSATMDQGKIHIAIVNHIPATIKKVESTRIGLKTCERICVDMHGEFTYTEEDGMFTVWIDFPIVTEEEKI